MGLSACQSNDGKSRLPQSDPNFPKSERIIRKFSLRSDDQHHRRMKDLVSIHLRAALKRRAYTLKHIPVNLFISQCGNST